MKFAYLFALLIALIAFIRIQSVQADNAVVDLTKDTFYNFVTTSEKPIIVKFTTSWCGHCKNVAPIFQDAANSTDEVIFANVDCEKNRLICSNYQVRGYPTIKLFKDGKYTEYDGPREVSGFIFFAKNTEADVNIPYQYPAQVQEILHDLNEIWHIRRNALGLIVLTTFLTTMIISACFCARTKIVYKEKKD
jgi:protein disulfide-isomerase-like protein